MGRACSMYGGEEKCIDSLDGETWKETTWMTKVWIRSQY
jgi:hypothetical protein